MSISKAQAQALSDGFLNDLGSEKDGFRPRETLSELFLLAGELIEDAQKNLVESNSISTGNLSASLVADEPVQQGKIVRLDILMSYYGRFVNKGVKGINGGQGLYQFKTPYPSEKMVKALSAYIKTAGAGVSNPVVKKYGAYGKHEKKNVDLQHAGAYALARSIKMKGIKPTGFLDKAIVSTVNKVEERLGARLKVDVINSLGNI